MAIRLNGETKNILAENLSKMEAWFPEVFEEGMIDFEKLKQILGEYVDVCNEKYCFNWNGKANALKLSQTPSKGTLRPCKADSKNWENTQNLYIEGDNLEVLKLLQKSYFGKIKMIYIDPPYNTGGDFVYKDDFANSLGNYKAYTGQLDTKGKVITTNVETNGRFHTDWLNMMYPRLRLARNLLAEGGSIFISIDNHEIDNLLKICDEIFGRSNRVSCIVNVNNPKGRSDEKNIATANEYIVVYKKGEAFFSGFDPEEKVIKRYNKIDEKGNLYRHIDLRKTGDSDRREDRPKMYYYFYYNDATKDFFPSTDNIVPEGYIRIAPMKNETEEGRWRMGIETAAERIGFLEPVYMAVKKKWTVMERDFFDENTKVKATSAWTFKDLNSERGTEQFVALGFDKNIFPRPKPVGTILRPLKIATQEDDIVLDFFSGSAATAQAVICANAADGGKRRYIMIQIPEICKPESVAYSEGYNNICEIGKERIRRAGEKIKTEIEEQNAQLEIGKEQGICPDIGFKVFKLDSSNIKEWQPNYDAFDQTLTDSLNNFVEGRTEEDVVYEIMLKMGLDLTYPVEEIEVESKTVYSIGFGALMICLDNEITTEVAEGMVKLFNEQQPETWKVVFKDNGFKDDSAKTNIKEILKLAGLEEDAFTTI